MALLALPFLFFPFAFASSNLALMKDAKQIETHQPDKACDIYKKLSLEKNFALKDLAFIKQGLVCVDPFETVPSDLGEKPWLTKADLERRLKMALRKGDLVGIATARSERARLERSPKIALAELRETDLFIKKSQAANEEKKKARQQVQQIREEIAPRFVPNPKPEQFLKVAHDFLSAREFDAARKWALKVRDNPKTSFDDQLAARRIARTSFKIEKKTDSFLKSLKDDWSWSRKQKFPSKSAELGLLYAKALWTEGLNNPALQVLSQMQKLFDKASVLNEIQFVRGKMREEKKDWTGAFEQYEKTGTTLDLKNAVDKKIQFGKAWVSWKSGQYEKVILALDPLIALGDEDPFENARGLFWKARSLTKLDKKDEAQKTWKELQARDPLGFYGTLSYRELNEKFPPLRVPQTSNHFQRSPLYDHAYFQALYDLNEPEILQAAATWHLSRVKSTDPIESWLPLFLAAARANSYLPLFSQISTLTPEGRRDLLQRDPELVFPLDYKDLIVTSAQKFSLPPELVLSIIRQESAFNTFARSPADALGLMQLLPSATKPFQKEVGITVEHFEDLYRPEVNVPYGTALLKTLMKKHDQKIYLAAAAYNASEKALKMWLKMRWNNDPIEFIEEIPYEETRAYVKLILRNFAFYSRLLNSGEPTAFPEACLRD